METHPGTPETESSSAGPIPPDVATVSSLASHMPPRFTTPSLPKDPGGGSRSTCPLTSCGSPQDTFMAGAP